MLASAAVLALNDTDLSFVPGWAVSIPLILLAGVLVWGVLDPLLVPEEGHDPQDPTCCYYWHGDQAGFNLNVVCLLCKKEETDE